jgi:hypothetical protein
VATSKASPRRVADSSSARRLSASALVVNVVDLTAPATVQRSRYFNPLVRCIRCTVQIRTS